MELQEVLLADAAPVGNSGNLIEAPSNLPPSDRRAASTGFFLRFAATGLRPSEACLRGGGRGASQRRPFRVRLSEPGIDHLVDTGGVDRQRSAVAAVARVGQRPSREDARDTLRLAQLPDRKPLAIAPHKQARRPMRM